MNSLWFNDTNPPPFLPLVINKAVAPNLRTILVYVAA